MISVTTPSEMFDLTSLRAAVVGGTGVLGSRFAQCLALAGAYVAVLGRSADRGNAVVSEIIAQGGNAEFLTIDVTDRATFDVATTALRKGGGVDILVNAPGLNSSAAFADLSDEEWNRLLEVNLTSVFRLCQAFAPLMYKRPNGASIINISSASSGPPLSRVLGYGVAKAGVNNLTQYLARELADEGVRVNAILPGFFPAEQNRALLTDERVESIKGHTPLRRLGVPEELEGTVLWLASPRASGFVTGALVKVDGGFSAMTI
jgi:NAD(P)-dependent dehydrogenase (short-subunit alcohol dehydrogenase family)